MPKLNQIVAIEKGLRNRRKADLTATYHGFQKPHLMNGIARTYRPKDDNGEQFPNESTKVQFKSEEALKEGKALLSKVFQVTALKDYTNTQAKADVVVDAKVLLKDAPVPYLLWLEKELDDLHTIFSALPTLDPSEDWSYDAAQNCYVTKPVETVKTKKIPRNHVKAEATDRHPAQVDVFTEDVEVGYWKTVKFSGALPAKTVHDLCVRVQTLKNAVQFARESANAVETVPQPATDPLLEYVFG